MTRKPATCPSRRDRGGDESGGAVVGTAPVRSRMRPTRRPRRETGDRTAAAAESVTSRHLPALAETGYRSLILSATPTRRLPLRVLAPRTGR